MKETIALASLIALFSVPLYSEPSLKPAAQEAGLEPLVQAQQEMPKAKEVLEKKPVLAHAATVQAAISEVQATDIKKLPSAPVDVPGTPSKTGSTPVAQQQPARKKLIVQPPPPGAKCVHSENGVCTQYSGCVRSLNSVCLEYPGCVESGPEGCIRYSNSGPNIQEQARHAPMGIVQRPPPGAKCVHSENGVCTQYSGCVSSLNGVCLQYPGCVKSLNSVCLEYAR